MGVSVGSGGILRRDARAVERGGLENRCTGNGTEGSNPSLSAKRLSRLKQNPAKP